MGKFSTGCSKWYWLQYIWYNPTISIIYVFSDIPLMTGTGEQIIRTALARDLCERADPNTCEDTLSGIERGFKLFSGI